MKQAQALIQILRDLTADEAERDDAAMDLADYDEPEVEGALTQVGSDPASPGSVAGSCGEALAEIWIRRGRFNAAAYALLRGEARHEAEALIRAKQPDWLALQP